MKAITWFVVALTALQHVERACGQLNYYFYTSTCPDLEKNVFNAVRSAVMNETRMATSLAFINGCDGSVLLDDTDSMIGEKTAAPNRNSARGFEVIDNIKTAVENSCKATVSCADILSLAARDSVYLSGGPYWPVSLGRRDGKTASKSVANANLPSPFESLDSIINKFQAVGLSVKDVVVLSGAHTIGAAHCNTFKSRLFNFKGTSNPDLTIEPSLLGNLQTLCPEGSNDPSTLASLDPTTQNIFDNAYFRNLQNNKGVLQSDQTLFSTLNASTLPYVNFYSNYPHAFFIEFHMSMIKLANLNVLTGSDGEIRKNCRFVN